MKWHDSAEGTLAMAKRLAARNHAGMVNVFHLTAALVSDQKIVRYFPGWLERPKCQWYWIDDLLVPPATVGSGDNLEWTSEAVELTKIAEGYASDYADDGIVTNYHLLAALCDLCLRSMLPGRWHIFVNNAEAKMIRKTVLADSGVQELDLPDDGDDVALSAQDFPVDIDVDDGDSVLELSSPLEGNPPLKKSAQSHLEKYSERTGAVKRRSLRKVILGDIETVCLQGFDPNPETCWNGAHLNILLELLQRGKIPKRHLLGAISRLERLQGGCPGHNSLRETIVALKSRT